MRGIKKAAPGWQSGHGGKRGKRMNYNKDITHERKCQHWQRVVYVIEDAIYLAMCLGAIALVCWVCGTALRIMGVQ